MKTMFPFARLTMLAVLPLSGCGTQYSLKDFSPTEKGPKSAFVDIKQRAVLAANRPAGAAGGNVGDLVMCAEPSPDALSSFASELALDLKAKNQVAAQFALSQQEAASFVGLRTQSIQLLRDGMYRLCEGYMAGALTSADFSWLTRRYQKNMVALLTIEQLTRVAQVPAFAQLSQGMASASRSATAIQGDLEEIDAKRAALAAEKTKMDAELVEAEKLPETDDATKADKAKKVKDIKTRQSDKQAAIARVDEIRSALLEGLRTAKGLLTSGATTVQVIADGKDGRASPTEAVAKAIAEITNNVIMQDDLGTLCFQLLAGDRSTRSTTGLEKNCAKIVEARATFDEERLRVFMGKTDKQVQASAGGKTTSEVDGSLDPLAGLGTMFLTKRIELSPETRSAISKQRKDAPPTKKPDAATDPKAGGSTQSKPDKKADPAKK